MIKAENLEVTFREGLLRRKVRALDGLSLRVDEGDIFGLLGPNGAGKTTALYCLLGLIRPDAGEVTINGHKPRPGSELFEEFVYLPEEPDYHLHLTVAEALDFYSSLYNSQVPEPKKKQVLETMDLWQNRKRKLKACSKGMKQKLGLATCLLRQPRVLFLDEPTRGLDPIMNRRFREELLEMNQQGTTVFINSHVLSEVEMICNRVAVMDRGKAKVTDRLENLLEYDPDSYRALVEAETPLPADAEKIETRSGRWVINCPRAQVVELFDSAAEADKTVYECSLRQASLEEVFVDLFKGGEES